MSVPFLTDSYAWIGTSGGSWGVATNWQDLTSGAYPATSIPGAFTPVTITGLAGSAFAAIAGGGTSASLGLTDNVALSGAYTIGAVSVGKRTTAGAGSSSISYVYAAGALIVSASLTASTLNLASGSLGLVGTGATLATAGAVTVGAQSVIGSVSPASYDPGAAASLSVAAGTTLTAGAMAVAQGAVLVSGAGANVSVGGLVSLGAAGVPPVIGSPYAFDSTGSIAIADGGVFAIGNALTQTAGSVSVDGAGSRLTIQTILTLGLAAASFGARSLGVTNGGRVQADGIVIQAPATSSAGPAAPSMASLYVDGAGSIEIGSGVAAAGTITIDAGKSIAATTDTSITGAIVDNGVLSATGGTLTLNGNLSGTGVLQIGRNGTVMMNGDVAASNSIAFTDAAAALVIGTNAATGAPYSIAAAISFFQLGDTIVCGVAASLVVYAQITTNSGTLTLFNGATALATLAIIGDYTPISFVLSPTITGGSSISLLAPQIGNGGTPAPNADLYAWIGATGGYWRATSNWQDTTSPGNTGQFVPGGLTAVTIAGPPGSAYEVIRGGGSSASLALTGNVDLNGFYQAGALSVGARIATGVGSSSVSYVHAAGALILANIVTATSVNLISGSLSLGVPGLGGTSSTLVASGAVTVGAQSVTGVGPPASYDPGAAGSISLAAGASLTAAGAMTIRRGSVSVSGAGANVLIFGRVSLGAAGVPPLDGAPYSSDATGSIVLRGGGLFTAASSLTEIVGSINVDGAGSRLNVQSVLTLGPAATTRFGTHSLSVTNGGRLQAGGLAIQAPATRNAGTAVISPPALFVDAISSIEIGSGTAASGTITIDAGQSITVATDATIAGAIVDNGVLSQTGGNLTLIGNLSGSGTLRIGANGSVTMNGSIAAGNSIVFTDATASLLIGTNATTGTPYSIGAPISGWQPGDSIGFGAAATSVAYAVTGTNVGTLTLFNGGTVIATFAVVGNYAPRSFGLGWTAAGGRSIGLRAIPPAASDFDGDGCSDILWQNDDGPPAIWQLKGTTFIGSTVLGNPGASWHVKGSGDFNGDGKSDILWQNDDGSVAVWLMNATSVLGTGVIGNPGPSWHVKGSGDFNGDGKSDILWQNDDGSVAIWQMNTTSVIGAAVIGNPGPSWHVKSSGDFNGDGKSDILWQNDDGSAAIWEMNATSVIGAAVLGNPGPSWHVEGSGDFNGDGKSDILWQNDDGSVAIWLLNGTSILGTAVIGNPGPSWHVKGSGDYNGDGKSDVLWQNDDGSVAIWELNGTSIIDTAVLGNSGTSWHTIGTDGMRFISGATGNGTLAATSEDDIFVFTSFAAGAHAISGFNPAHDLIELALASFANFAAVQTHSTASGGGTLIALNGSSSLLIQGVAPGALGPSDFRFV